MGREVITIQAGGFANYVGAHYWNFQVSAVRSRPPTCVMLCTKSCQHICLGFCIRCTSATESSRLPQDELLGLASDAQEGYLAEQIDPTVVQRQHEDRQVGVVYCLNTWYPHSTLTKLSPCCKRQRPLNRSVPEQGNLVYTPRAVIFDLNGSLGGMQLHSCPAQTLRELILSDQLLKTSRLVLPG